MKDKTDLNKLKIMFYFFAILLPISALLLASQNSVEFINFSYIGNTMEKRFLLMLWGFSSFACFFLGSLYLYKLCNFNNKKNLFFTFIACLMMFLSTLIPYLPKDFPFLSFLHLFLSFGSTLIYVITFYMFIYSLILYDPLIYEKANGYYTMIVFACVGVIMIYGGVNSLSEMMFTILLPLFQVILSRSIVAKEKAVH